MDPKPSTRERRRAKRTRAILDAAAALIERDGLSALTVGRLADALDYTPGALYRYFPSKDAILIRLQRDALLHFARALDPLDHLAGPDPLARLHARVAFHLGLPLAAPAEYRLLAVTLADPRPLVQDDLAQDAIDAFATFLARYASPLLDLPLPNPAACAITLLATLQGLLPLHKLARFGSLPFDPERAARDACDSLLRGWGLDPRDLPPARAHIDTLGPCADLAQRCLQESRS